MKSMPGRRSAIVAAALVAAVALGAFLVARDDRPNGRGGPFLVDDFESGSIAEWRVVVGGSGGWFVYSDGQEAPDPSQTDPNVPFNVHDPPQGKFAVVTDMNGPGTRILYRDLRLAGRFKLHATLFYASSVPFNSPQTLAYDVREPNQQFRMDLVRPSAPVDSLASGDVLVNVFHTSSADLFGLQPAHITEDVSRWAGQTVRLRLAVTDNGGPLRVGVDNIFFEQFGTEGAGRIELLDTPEPSSALNLVLHRLSEEDALAALSAHAGKLARADEFSGAVLVAREGKVLLEDAWGHEDREAGTLNTPETRFRIGSMNKMFTAVAMLQLVEAGKVALDDPIGMHLPDYPNKGVASKGHGAASAHAHCRDRRHLRTGVRAEPPRAARAHRLREDLRLARARSRAGRATRVLELRLHPARCAHRGRERGFVLRVRSQQRLRPGRHDLHGLAPRIRGGAEPCGGVHEAISRR
jgi:hypothetical protein